VWREFWYLPLRARELDEVTEGEQLALTDDLMYKLAPIQPSTFNRRGDQPWNA